MKTLKLTFYDQEFYAELLVDKAPKLIQELEKVCPFDSKLAYAKICNDEIFFQAPFDMMECENPVFSVAGHIAYYAPKQTICIWYRNDTPSLGECDLFALLSDEDIERFAKTADQVWDKQGEIIHVEIVGEGEKVC